MTDQDPRAAATALFEAMNNRDLDLLSSWLAPDAVFDFPGTKLLEGPDRIVRFIKILFHRYPELEFTTGRVIADGAAAAVEWTNQGRDRKDEPYRNAGVTIVELEDGKIGYLSDTFKDTAVFTRR
jgi:ketosteroid isomerase-like protein